MILTLTGDNDYLIFEELKRLKNEPAHNELSISQLYGGEAELETVKSELVSYSLFAKNRLVILYQPHLIKGFEEYIEKAEITDATSLVIIEPSLDRRTSYFKYLKTKTDFREFQRLNTPILNKWAVDKAKELGGNLSLADASYLVDRIGDDQMLLNQELNKLILYAPEVKRTSIDLLSEPSLKSTIFELLDAAFSLSPSRALKIYAEQRLKKVEPEEVLAMMAWQLRVLAMVIAGQKLSQPELIRTSGLSPFTVSKARTMSLKIGFSKLKVLVSDLTDLDYRHKTSTLDLDEGLKNFIVGLSL